MKTCAINGIIGWDVTESSIRDFLKEANGDPVRLEVSSPGGFIAPGLGIFNAIRNYQGEIDCVIVGYAMSMASYIPLAVKDAGGKLRAEDNAVYMIHNARGGTWGDHNDVLGYGNFLKGLSGVLARQYVKTTGKDLAEITGMMDKETYFFGEDMVTNGFVDEIIQSTSGGDKDSALALARASFDDAVARMSRDAAAVRQDIQLASAALCINLDVPTQQPPATAGKDTGEGGQQAMKLSDLLAQNPAAQAEFDAAIATARQEGEKAAKDTMAAVVAKVTPVLTSTEYPQAVKDVAVKALTGETSTEAMDTVVSTLDAIKQADATGKAAGEQGKETPAGQQHQLEPGAVVASGDDLAVAVAQYKKDHGRD